MGAATVKDLQKPVSWRFERKHARGLMREYDQKNLKYY